MPERDIGPYIPVRPSTRTPAIGQPGDGERSPIGQGVTGDAVMGARHGPWQDRATRLEANRLGSQLDRQPYLLLIPLRRPPDDLRDQLSRQDRAPMAQPLVDALEERIDLGRDRLHAQGGIDAQARQRATAARERGARLTRSVPTAPPPVRRRGVRHGTPPVARPAPGTYAGRYTLKFRPATRTDSLENVHHRVVGPTPAAGYSDSLPGAPLQRVCSPRRIAAEHKRKRETPASLHSFLRAKLVPD